MPRMPSSEIIERFIQTLDKEELTKQAYPNLKSYEDDPQARMGSDDISTIEVMYGVKPDAAETMEYEANIMERAHSKSVVIAPSYDKINGLVENNNERNQIMQNVALKPPTGNHSNPKYAHRELVLELVRVANEMDARNHPALFKLADACLLDLNKQAGWWDDAKSKVKEWFGPDVSGVGSGVMAGAGIGAAAGALVTSWSGPGMLFGATGGAMLGGLIAAFAKTAPQVKNVEENAHKVLDELADLEKKVPEQDKIFKVIKQALNDMVTSANTYAALIEELKLAHIKGASETQATVEPASVQQVTQDLIKNIKTVRDLHAEFDRLAATGAFAKADPSSTLSPLYWFIKDDVEDVSDAFVSLSEACEKLVNSSKGAASSSATEKSAPPAPQATKPDAKTLAVQELLQGKMPSGATEWLNALK